jgi:hypothetical protein
MCEEVIGGQGVTNKYQNMTRPDEKPKSAGPVSCNRLGPVKMREFKSKPEDLNEKDSIGVSGDSEGCKKTWRVRIFEARRRSLRIVILGNSKSG